MEIRQYNTTSNLPYPFVSDARMSMDLDGNGSGVYMEQEAISFAVDSDLPADDNAAAAFVQRKAVFTQSSGTQHPIQIPRQDMDVGYQLYDPSTGNPLPTSECAAIAGRIASGQASGRILYLVVWSCIHRDQLRRDAQGTGAAVA